jgi:hypothetical protein
MADLLANRDSEVGLVPRRQTNSDLTVMLSKACAVTRNRSEARVEADETESSPFGGPNFQVSRALTMHEISGNASSETAHSGFYHCPSEGSDARYNINLETRNSRAISDRLS